MAGTRSFICCLLYWTAINGLGECANNELSSAPHKDDHYESKSVEFPSKQRMRGHMRGLRSDNTSPVYRYLHSTPGQAAQDFVTYGSTMVMSSPKLTANFRGQRNVENPQESPYVKTDRKTEPPAGSVRHTSSENRSKPRRNGAARKKRVIDSQRMLRYRKQFSPLPHQETSANLSENPPTYRDEETRGSRSKKNKHGRGNRNRKQGGRKKTNLMETGQTLEEELIMVGSNKSGRTKGKSRKLKIPTSRDGQSNRRLRQHMQHKKKVKQFLQKRIQEQIAQRRHRRGILA